MHHAAFFNHLIKHPLHTCLEAYSSDFQSCQGDLLLVQYGTTLLRPRPTRSHRVVKAGSSPPHAPSHHTRTAVRNKHISRCAFSRGTIFFSCLLPSGDDLSRLKDGTEKWRVLGVERGIRERYALLVKERCRLLLSPVLYRVVRRMSLVKAGVMMTVALGHGSSKDEGKSIRTVGDVMAEFMRKSDTWIVNMGCGSRKDLEKFKKTQANASSWYCLKQLWVSRSYIYRRTRGARMTDWKGFLFA